MATLINLIIVQSDSAINGLYDFTGIEFHIHQNRSLEVSIQ